MADRKKRKLAEMDVGEFMRSGFDSDSDDSSETKNGPPLKSKQRKKEPENKTRKQKETVKHKKSLEKLKEEDPEFYEFLQNEDSELLEFNSSDEGDDDVEEESDDEDMSDDDEENDEDDEKDAKGPKKRKEMKTLEDLEGMDSSDSEEEKGSTYHKLPQELEEASDASDDSDDDIDDDSDDEDAEAKEKPKKSKKQKGGTLVTNKMIKKWTGLLQDKPNALVVREVISVFKAAVQKACGGDEALKYRVEGSSEFNTIIRMCMSNMSTALHKVLGLPPLTDLQKPSLPSHDNKKWKMIRVEVKTYLVDLLQLLEELSEPSMMAVILRHVHRLVAFYSCFPRLAKTMMKRMITLWSTGEETTRVLAFLCINRLIHISQKTLLEPCIKQLYMAYVKNSKFTSPNTLPVINFMQRSLVEIFAVDFVLTYQFAFLYIRQLAIHLRNAVTVKKKDTCQAVYNWQYIHCMELWVRLLSATYPNEALEPLIYPLTQTLIGTIKLLPTTRYYPLRFHCVKSLNTLSEATGVFIPVLPFLLEVFEQTDFNKKHKSISAKPFNFACILKFSKAQLQEKVFKDGLIDQLYELLLENFNVHAHTIGFPELSLPALLQLREFLKKCKVANYCKQIKQIVDKVEETCKFITNRRKSVNISLSDTKAIEAWERQCKDAGTPLSKYYTTWRKLRDRELQHQIASKDQIVGLDDIPTIQRPRVLAKATKEEKEEFDALFDTDSDESDDETRFLPKKERPQKKEKKREEYDSSDSQEYSDFDSDELEILARSGDEDSASEDDDDVEIDDDDEDGDDDVETAADADDDGVDDAEDVVEDFEMSDSD